MEEAIYILDSTAFYSGIPYQGNGRYYTTYQVLEEVKHQSVGSSLIHSRVTVTEPSPESVERVKTIASQTGDLTALSMTDVSLIALALDLSKSGGRTSLISDDFAIRNVAEVLGLPLSETNIRGEWKKITWMLYCKGCGKQYTNPKLTTCIVCGTPLTKKAVDKS